MWSQNVNLTDTKVEKNTDNAMHKIFVIISILMLNQCIHSRNFVLVCRITYFRGKE
jgi:hypothetical protein